ncbi:MAG: heat-inducible transcription repressor HrcA [Deltaproteobacteria bacterium]|nr:heat-inducible transcription repressor HrcA [Deltaproteobacteria bacterium]
MPSLSERQKRVLGALVASFVGDAAPVGSKTLSHLPDFNLSAASIRNTMSELSEMGLIEQPHASAGRVPTDLGLRIFVDRLVPREAVASAERRALRHGLDEESDADGVIHITSHLLSQLTRQLGFVVSPSLSRVQLRHLSLVRLSRERVLVMLISQAGQIHRRTIEDAASGDQAELDRITAILNERVAGHTLDELVALLRHEAERLRTRAEDTIARAIHLGERALALTAESDAAADLVIATHMALLDQPEFADSERLRELFAAIETKERLVELFERVLAGEPRDAGGVRVALGEELAEPGLRHCALVAAPYGGDPGALLDTAASERSGARAPLGVLGVIGPTRMNYAHIIPLVGYCSRLVTEKINETTTTTTSTTEEST